MNFELSPEQQALRNSIRRFCEREYDFAQRHAVVMSPHGDSAAHWRSFAELGWLGAGLAEEAGGFGGGAVENALILEQFGRALVVEPLIGHLVALHVLAELAAGEQADMLAAMVGGESRVALAHLEAAGRGDSFHLETRVQDDATGLRLTGGKSVVLGGGLADQFLVSAREGNGVSLFIVPADAAGLHRQVYRTLDNHRVADLLLDGVSVEDAARIGPPAGAAAALAAAIDHGIVYLCAEAVGAMETALWMTRDYLKTRQQFGAPLGSFQALQHRMADMLIETELSRSMLYQGLVTLCCDDAKARSRGVSAAKVQIAQAGLFVGGQAIQLHGGIGIAEEHAIGHFYKRLFVIAQLFGNADHHLDRFRA